MSAHIRDFCPGYDEYKFVFANTGQEHDDTLRFVSDISERFNLNTVWVEALVHPLHGKGTTHKVVSHNTAARWSDMNGPFVNVCGKYGLPNMKFPQCTRELKQRPIMSYMRSIGWKTGTYDTALGIRVDEFDRISPRSRENRIIYPLVKHKIRKQDVLNFFSEYHSDIDLRIPERLGNCLWCWKKSHKKLQENVASNPEMFDFPAMLEERFKMVGPERKKGPDGHRRRMFRGELKVADVVRGRSISPEEDLPNACSESCEVTFE